MTSYETVWEIFNECPNNQMRDVFFDEIEVEDTDAFIQSKFRGKELKMDKTVHADGTIVYELWVSGMHERYTFTPF